MNARLHSSTLRTFRKAPLVAGLALACAGLAAHAADRSRPTFEQRLDAHRIADRQHLARRAKPPRAPERPAGTLTVSNCDDVGAGSLREAFASAVSGDVIDLTALDCSTITLTSGALATSADDLTLNGPGAALLAIDGNNQDRIIDHSGTGTLTLNALALRNGLYDGTDTVYGEAHGGCVLSTGGVTLDGVAIDHCSAIAGRVTGGAIRANYIVQLTDSTISGTTVTATRTGFSAGAYGGAIYGGVAYLDRSTISDATITVTSTETAFGGSVGGGILTFGGVVLTDSTVTGVSVSVSAPKDAYAEGGGIGARNAIILINSTVSNNTVTGTPGAGLSGAYTYRSAIRGGGLYIGRTPKGAAIPATITNSTISGNAALVIGDPGAYTYNGGGGILAHGQSVVTITNSTVSGNSTALNGGGLYAHNFGAFALANATITDNTAQTGGGIVDAGTRTSSDLVTNSSIIAGNHTLGDPANDIETIHTISGANNLITSANVPLPVGTLTGDPMLAPLADNGGATLTHALSAGSPAIDHGNNAASLQNDQRGAGYARVTGGSADIGAFELQTPGDTIFANGFD
jgi:hypothetical protein